MPKTRGTSNQEDRRFSPGKGPGGHSFARTTFWKYQGARPTRVTKRSQNVLSPISQSLRYHGSSRSTSSARASTGESRR